MILKPKKIDLFIKTLNLNIKDDEEEDDYDDGGEKESSKVKKEKVDTAELLTRATRGAVIQNKTRGVRMSFLMSTFVFIYEI